MRIELDPALAEEFGDYYALRIRLRNGRSVIHKELEHLEGLHVATEQGTLQITPLAQSAVCIILPETE